jgi:hypothetical protein
MNNVSPGEYREYVQREIRETVATSGLMEQASQDRRLARVSARPLRSPRFAPP